MSIAQKRMHRLPPPVLFSCRICKMQGEPLKVTGIDRQGHVDRCHRGGDILIVFEVVRAVRK